MLKRLLYNRKPELLRYGIVYILIPIFLSGLQLKACESQPTEVPASPIVEVVTATISSTSPSATPSCTTMLPGMSIAIHPSINSQMLILLKGFKPGEMVDVTIEANNEHSLTRSNFSAPIGPVGSASESAGTLSSDETTKAHWHVRIVHAHGIACADLDIP
jgi:hypothetical protein